METVTDTETVLHKVYNLPVQGTFVILSSLDSLQNSDVKFMIKLQNLRFLKPVKGTDVHYCHFINLQSASRHKSKPTQPTSAFLKSLVGYWQVAGVGSRFSVFRDCWFFIANCLLQRVLHFNIFCQHSSYKNLHFNLNFFNDLIKTVGRYIMHKISKSKDCFFLLTT